MTQRKRAVTTTGVSILSFAYLYIQCNTGQVLIERIAQILDNVLTGSPDDGWLMLKTIRLRSVNNS